MVAGVLRNPRKVLDGRAQGPHGEYIGNRVATLVGGPQDRVRRSRSTLGVPVDSKSAIDIIENNKISCSRDSCVAFQTVEQDVEAGADMKLCVIWLEHSTKSIINVLTSRACPGVERIYYA